MFYTPVIIGQYSRASSLWLCVYLTYFGSLWQVLSRGLYLMVYTWWLDKAPGCPRRCVSRSFIWESSSL